MLPNWISDLDDISLKIYQFIEYQKVYEQRSPSIGEISRELNIPKSTVNKHLRTLEEAQLIYCEPNKHCGIKLLKDPKRGMPLIGRIAAGEPLEIFAEQDQMIDMGNDLHDINIYALQVKGWSMIEDLISDGDYIAIQRQHTYEKNDIIVAVHLPPNTATLKRFVQEGGQVRLEPSNSKVDPIYIPSKEWEDEWEVQGKVIRMSRTYVDPKFNWMLNQNRLAAKKR